MTTKEANKKASQLFNKWKKEFLNYSEMPTPERDKKIEDFIEECRQFHNVVGLYEVLTDKNALKMASICSSLRFVEPYRMLMQLQKTTGTY
jgi:hypothetical protein